MINENLQNLKNTMQDIMIYYKLRYSFSKDVKDMSKNKNLDILNIDEKMVALYFTKSTIKLVLE